MQPEEPEHDCPPRQTGDATVDDELESAHRHSIYHRDEILSSALCGCFYCRSVYPPECIIDWADQRLDIGQTAICPRCGIDAVIGDGSGYAISEEFLNRMRRYWF